MNKRKIVFAALTLVWAGVIFSFSAKEGSDSADESRKVGRLICSIFVPGYDKMPEDKQYEMAGMIDYPVRKAAHGAEYAVLGLFAAGAAYNPFKTGRYNISVPWAAGTLYAATDEIHQYFVPGRSCKVTDVIIDSAGMLAGVAAVVLFMIILRRNNHLQITRNSV